MLKVKKRAPKKACEVKICLTRAEVDAAVEHALTAAVVGIDTETTGCNPAKESPVYKATAFSVQISVDNVSYFIPTFNAEGVADFRSLIEELRPLICKASGNVVMHGAKYDMHVFENAGLRPHRRALLADTLAMSYTHNGSYERHGLKECVKRWFGDDTVEFKPTFKVPKLKKNGEPGKATRMPDLLEVITSKQKYLQDIFFERVRPFREKIAGARKAALRLWLACKGKISKLGAELIISYAALDPVYTARLYEVLKEKMQAKSWANGKNLFEYFNLVEVPYTTVLYRMERRGVPLSKKNLLLAKEKAESKIAAALKLFNKLAVKAGAPVERMEKFNTKSGKDIAWLFKEVIGVKGQTKRRKNGTESESWDEKTLEKLKTSKKAKPLVEALLEFRAAAKILSTYIIPFLRFHKEYKGRVHTTFKQTGTKTARLSCISGDTSVRTRQGMMPARGIVAGDEVWTHRGRWRRVLRAFTKGYEHMYDVRLCNGQVLTCTADHRLLNQSGEWVRLGDIADGYFKNLGRFEEECRTGAGDVSVGRVPDHAAGGGEVGDLLHKRIVHHEQVHVFEREEGALGSEVLQVQGRRQEPHEGEVRQEASQLDRRGGRRVRLLDLSVAGEAAVRSSRGDDESTRSEVHAYGLVRASHRRKSEEQRLGQSGPLHALRASSHPSSGGEEASRGVEIEEILPVGVHEVFDFTVDEDHSYESAGVMSHNSSSPNLQNVPRLEEGVDADDVGIRHCFVPSEKPKSKLRIGAIDQAQIEARLTAHFTQDEAFLEAIHKGWDLHALTASKAYANVREFVGVQDITPELLDAVKANFKKERQDAKVVNFSTIYGIGAKGLAENIGCKEREAQDLLDGFFAGYPGVKRSMKKTQQFAAEKGYVRSMLRRYVYCKDAQSSVPSIRARGFRQAFNFLIQGSAGDMVKLAMIKIENDMRLRKMGVQMCLQVHDELVLLCEEKYTKRAGKIIEKYLSFPMEAWGFKSLTVPTPADIGWSDKSWGEAKG